jgi:hypothetical protein
MVLSTNKAKKIYNFGFKPFDGQPRVALMELIEERN